VKTGWGRDGRIVAIIRAQYAPSTRSRHTRRFALAASLASSQRRTRRGSGTRGSPGARVAAGARRPTVRRQGIWRNGSADRQRYDRMPEGHRYLHGCGGRHGLRPARRVQRRHAPTEGQRDAARRGRRHALPDSGQCAVPARASCHALRGECREPRHRRTWYARRARPVRIRPDAGRGSGDHTGNRNSPGGRRRHAEVLPGRRADLHVHPEQLPPGARARYFHHPLPALERPPERLRPHHRARRLHLLGPREGGKRRWHRHRLVPQRHHFRLDHRDCRRFDRAEGDRARGTSRPGRSRTSRSPTVYSPRLPRRS
jgi:hypothetical protein